MLNFTRLHTLWFGKVNCVAWRSFGSFRQRLAAFEEKYFQFWRSCCFMSWRFSTKYSCYSSRNWNTSISGLHEVILYRLRSKIQKSCPRTNIRYTIKVFKTWMNWSFVILVDLWWSDCIISSQKLNVSLEVIEKQVHWLHYYL